MFVCRLSKIIISKQTKNNCRKKLKKKIKEMCSIEDIENNFHIIEHLISPISLFFFEMLNSSENKDSLAI